MHHRSSKNLLVGLLSLAFAFPVASAMAGETPAVSIKKAVELAEQALADKGMSGQVFIQSISLQRTAPIGGRTVWSVSWSGPVPASDPIKKEVGLEISMEGNVVHLIKGPGEPVKKHGPR